MLPLEISFVFKDTFSNSILLLFFWGSNTLDEVTIPNKWQKQCFNLGFQTPSVCGRLDISKYKTNKLIIFFLLNPLNSERVFFSFSSGIFKCVFYMKNHATCLEFLFNFTRVNAGINFEEKNQILLIFLYFCNNW